VTAALIMAGGRGERMRAGGSSLPKPLVPVRGVPLLERNLLALLHAGFRDVTVAVPAHTPEIGRFVSQRCAEIASDFGSRLATFEETEPLGNIGAAAEIPVPPGGLLVVYADNLTSLDLTALVRHHLSTAAVLTSAVHYEPFRIPFGEVEVEDGWLTAYREKPEHRVLVSSGLCVLSREAVKHLPAGRPAGAAELVNQLLASGEKVAAFLHSDSWIDVNDASALERAEREVGDLTAAGKS
jgi:NDP-sugar pyrophosphorylase family protein